MCNVFWKIIFIVLRARHMEDLPLNKLSSLNKNDRISRYLI